MIRADFYNLFESEPIGRESLVAKKACCKSGCTNCPYGYTLKTHGLKFKKMEYRDLKKIEKYLGVKLSGVYSEYELVVFKDYLVGAVRVNDLFVTELYLHPFVSEQNLSKEAIESYYFY